MSALAEKSSVEVFTCLAGHEWERELPLKRGPKPIYCDEHKYFFTAAITQRLMPSDDARREWSVYSPEKAYIEKWTDLWKRSIRIMAAKRGSFGDIRHDDLVLLERYVRACRYVDLHRSHAEENPYQVSDTGSIVREHPGFALSEKEQDKADILAVELGLEPVLAVTTAKKQSKPSKLQNSASEHEDLATFGDDL